MSWPSPKARVVSEASCASRETKLELQFLNIGTSIRSCSIMMEEMPTFTAWPRLRAPNMASAPGPSSPRSLRRRALSTGITDFRPGRIERLASAPGIIERRAPACVFRLRSGGSGVVLRELPFSKETCFAMAGGDHQRARRVCLLSVSLSLSLSPLSVCVCLSGSVTVSVCLCICMIVLRCSSLLVTRLCLSPCAPAHGPVRNSQTRIIYTSYASDALALIQASGPGMHRKEEKKKRRKKRSAKHLPNQILRPRSARMLHCPKSSTGRQCRKDLHVAPCVCVCVR